MRDMVLCFANPGELDPRLITTFGANVKPASDSPIGYFGTGMKYAIAVALRLGDQVEIQAGEDRYSFRTEPTTIRGKEFQMIRMHKWPIGARGWNPSVELGFTLDLGRNWEAWMAYREFWCNAKDEGGEEDLITGEAPAPEAGITRVLIRGEALLAAHGRRHEFLLEGTPLQVFDGVELHQGPSEAVFYRGVKVLSLRHMALYAYNITAALTLTEDRTASRWDVESRLARALSQVPRTDIAHRLVTAKPETFEGEMDYQWSGLKPSSQFLEAARKEVRERPGDLNRTILGLVQDLDRGTTKPQEVELSVVEQQQLVRALRFAERRGLGEPSMEIRVADSLGTGTLGALWDGEIWIAREAFAQGTKRLAGTIIEEWVHKRHGHRDCSRELQNWLLDKLVGLGEELDGEPL